jgi:thioesterase domain-containing protein
MQRDPREGDPLAVWRRVAGRVDVAPIRATHLAMIQEPAVDEVAAALLSRLSA